MTDKKNLRKQIQYNLSSISKPSYEHMSYIIAQKLFQNPSWIKATTIAVTLSNPPEVDTFQIIRKAWEEGKKVVVPKCLPKTREMDFRILTKFSQLESVYSGLLEPIESETELIAKKDIQLVIVPGLGFSRKGFRLGFGGGYYDRFLIEYEGDTLSLAFEQQILESVPVEEHDIPVKQIISNEEIIVIHD
ncbi:5-formyltetrahydrofolate cyclo-ligase (plasmid) [Bacillus sp. 31A1R]|uniref:5-formyltetrahydrofolate cyclo-ligase n=1 Tax=Robertmurraya mangrovi TaxID=3098077 RepID=A0ABU5IV18_9BACI|nr:5-formyltetrahydrofolate cyclo-ligase [Bacillus sp. 31A1R]MDZ5470996.1 5-formyltetrahydrofolate cyclo-ligase [Bacillus sp. 31A1R]